MARKATGRTYFRRGKHWAQVTLGPKDRPTFALSADIATDEQAEARLETLADMARLMREAKTSRAVMLDLLREAAKGSAKDAREAYSYAKRMAQGEQFELASEAAKRDAEQGMSAWVEAWTADRRVRGRESAAREGYSHYHTHVVTVLGDKHVAYWTAADLRTLVAALDTKVHDGKCSWKTAVNVWSSVTKMCSDACRSKVETLRCREDNPARDVEGPDRGDRKAKQFLYPSEAERFIASDDVPLSWRRMVAIAIYLYVRAGELRVLRWRDVDLDHGIVHVHQAAKRDGGVKGTKGRRARRVPIEPAVMPLLHAMRDECEPEPEPDDRVVDMPSERTMARSLRAWLGRSGVDRPELHATSTTSKALTFHDLRATGITWMAVRGDDPLVIQQRAGHEDFATTQGYVRLAETLREGFGEPFPELPLELLGLNRRGKGALTSKSLKLQRGGRDSNPRPPA